MKTSESIVNLVKAFIEFQANVPVILKNAEGFGYKYTTLDKLIEATRKPLRDVGLAVLQTSSDTEKPNSVMIRTRLMHTSGEWIESELLMLSEKPGPQARGSCVKYGRRYSYETILGIVSEDDDDGRAAENTDADGAAAASSVTASLKTRANPNVNIDGYKFKAGKKKGKKLTDFTDKDLIGFVEWIENEDKTSPVKNALFDDYCAMVTYLSQEVKSEPPKKIIPAGPKTIIAAVPKATDTTTQKLEVKTGYVPPAASWEPPPLTDEDIPF